MLAKSTLFSFCSRAIFFDPKIAFLAPRRRFSPPGSLLRHGTSGFDLRIPTVSVTGNSHDTAFWGLSFMYQPAHKIFAPIAPSEPHLLGLNVADRRVDHDHTLIISDMADNAHDAHALKRAHHAWHARRARATVIPASAIIR